MKKILAISFSLTILVYAQAQTGYFNLKNGSSAAGLNDPILSNGSTAEFDGYGSDVPNSPVGGNWYSAVLTIGNSERGVQIAHGYPYYNELYFRGGTNGWNGWRKVLNDANFSSFALPLTGGTLTGNLILDGTSAPKVQLSNRLMMQMPMAPENSFTRSFVGQNISWETTSKKWSIADQGYSDFSMIRFENGGAISFFNRGMTGANDMTNAQLEEYKRVMIDQSGNFCIGTSAAQAKLDSRGSFALNRPSALVDQMSVLGVDNAIGIVPTNFSTANNGYVALSFPSNNSFRIGTDFDGHLGSGTYRNIEFGRRQGDPYMTINDGGNVGIGTNSPQAKLAVNGDIFSRKVKVAQTGWADYVFETHYRLPTLAEVEAYIKQNKHLPEVPSANEVEKNGLDLGDNQAVLLKKIEELTLYAIDQQKKIDDLQSQVKNLQVEIISIKKERN